MIKSVILKTNQQQVCAKLVLEVQCLLEEVVEVAIK